MRRRRRWSGTLVASTVLALLPLGGCYRHAITIGTGAPSAPLVLDQWEHFWIGGLVGHVDVDVARMCPSGNATVVAQQTFLNGLVSALTSGIYTPTTVRVRCEDGRRADLRLEADDVEAIVSDATFAGWVKAELPGRWDDVVAAQAALADRDGER